MTIKTDQAAIFNLAAQIVVWGFLANMILVTVTGVLVIWSLGQAIDIFGLFAIPSPIGRMPFLHEFMEEVHEVSGQAFIPLVILHVLGAVKHLVIDGDGVVIADHIPLMADGPRVGTAFTIGYMKALVERAEAEFA